MEPNRLRYVDILKGIGIICVVIGHVHTGEFSKVIYLFHMPLFFFVAGYLFQAKTNQKKFFREKAIQLLIPYTLYLILVYSLQEIIFFTNNPISLKAVLLSCGRMLLGGRWLGGYSAVFWFVPCFFLVQQLMNLLFIKFREGVMPIIMLIMLIIGYLNYTFAPNLRIPYDINVVLGAAPIFYIGYLTKKKLTINTKIWLPLVFSGIGILLILEGYDNFYDMKNAFYGIPFLTLLTGSSIIIVLLYLSKLYLSRLPVSNSLSTIGKASLVIMYLHQPIQIIIGDLLTSSEFIRICLSVILPLCAYLTFEKNTLSRAFLLGNRNDIKKLNVI